MMGKNVLVTGANGFIGAALCDHLESTGAHVNASIRKICTGLKAGRNYFETGDINSSTNWCNELIGVNAVVRTPLLVFM